MWDSLKEQTRINHQKLEKTFLTRLRRLSGSSEYADFLSHLYSFYHPLENTLDRYITPGILPDYPQRRKSKSLLEDISTLGLQFNSSGNPALPTVSTVSQAVGVLYVMEGSTHGGPVIAGMLSKQFNLPAQSLTYFLGYGPDTMRRWLDFKKHIDASANVLDQDQVLQAANSTFTNLNNWLLAH